jgi:hypothetical protein
MKRELTAHKVNKCNEDVQILVLDEPGSGGACHKYGINLLGEDSCSGPIIGFQNGPKCNEDVQILVLDEPGSGGACHKYGINLLGEDSCSGPIIGFQNGPIAEVGTNGVTQEALIAICIDRLQSFQAGPYACRENALALTKLEEAMHWLHHRTRERLARGVEGTHQK